MRLEKQNKNILKKQAELEAAEFEYFIGNIEK